MVYVKLGFLALPGNSFCFSLVPRFFKSHCGGGRDRGLAECIEADITMTENSKIEKKFGRFKTRVKDVGGIGKLSNEEHKRIVRFCRKQNPKCPACGERNTKFRYIENKKSARTLQPRYECSICKVRQDNKQKDFTWGGKRYRKRVTEQSNIQEPPYLAQESTNILEQFGSAEDYTDLTLLSETSTNVLEQFCWSEDYTGFNMLSPLYLFGNVQSTNVLEQFGSSEDYTDLTLLSETIRNFQSTNVLEQFCWSEDYTGFNMLSPSYLFGNVQSTNVLEQFGSSESETVPNGLDGSLSDSEIDDILESGTMEQPLNSSENEGNL